MVRRIMLIGRTGCGKRRLAGLLNGSSERLTQSPDIIFKGRTIVIPGGFLENPWMYKHIVTMAQNSASHLLFLVDGEDSADAGPPGFARSFNCPVLGVVTKCDLPFVDREKAVRQMKKLGVCKPYFFVSSESQQGIKELKQALAIFE